MLRIRQTDAHIQDESEKLFLEQAKVYYRDLCRAVQNAPYGQVIRQAELLALRQGHELIRRYVETIVQDQMSYTFDKTVC